MTNSAEPSPAPLRFRLSEILSALSYSLDLTEGQPMGHSVRSCILGMWVGKSVGLSAERLSDLYYALLLKDTGCSSNAARVFNIFEADDLALKRDLKSTDWTKVSEMFNYVRAHAAPGSSVFQRAFKIAEIAMGKERQAVELVQIRCERGAQIARKLGFSEETSAAIRGLDEHWDGQGYPEGLKGEAIPLFSRILGLSQTLEVFAALKGKDEAFRVVEERAGTWFDPELVKAARGLREDQVLWSMLTQGEATEHIGAMEPKDRVLFADEARIDEICQAFAEVVDAKSPFTYQHSERVARAAVGIATELKLTEGTVTTIRRAGLLHDIGKLGVSNAILDKPGKPTAQEWEAIRLHPYYTHRILSKIGGFRDLTGIASAHHERLDGSGYHMNLRAEQLSVPARALAVADVYDALSSARPYRAALPLEKVFKIMSEEVPAKLCPDCFEALKKWATRPPS